MQEAKETEVGLSLVSRLLGLPSATRPLEVLGRNRRVAVPEHDAAGGHALCAAKGAGARGAGALLAVPGGLSHRLSHPLFPPPPRPPAFLFPLVPPPRPTHPLP